MFIYHRITPLLSPNKKSLLIKIKFFIILILFELFMDNEAGPTDLYSLDLMPTQVDETTRQ